MVLHNERICVVPPKFYNFEDQYIAYPEEYITNGDGKIILPNKSPVIQDAINKNLEEFKESVASADFIIFIGFSFRNEHINSILEDSLQKETFVFVINPATIELELPNCMENRFYPNYDRNEYYKHSNNYMAEVKNFCHYFQGFDKDIFSQIPSYIDRGYYQKKAGEL